MNKLPMIEFAGSMMANNYLADSYVLGVQHILPTTLLMFEELFCKGLKPENLSIIGKCYSTDHKIYMLMKRRGIDVCSSSVEFDSHRAFDEAFQSNIHKFIHERKTRFNDLSLKKIIVLDDGGEFLSIINNYLPRFDHVFGVEQTSSGYNRLCNKQHLIPIINLARANSKLMLEPSRIINTCLKRIRDLLDDHPKNIQTVLIIGNGVIGTQLFETLKNQFNVLRYDNNPEKSDIPSEKFNECLSQADMIIGCTGTTSISQHQHEFLKKGTILVSCSSSDREFDAIHLRKKVAKPNSFTDHIDIEGITLMNCGFPINFNGQDDVDDPNFFQFIRALIIASIAQTGTPTQQKGFVDLDKSMQDLIISKFQSIPNLIQDPPLEK